VDFLRHIADCNRFEPADYVPFLIGSAAVGRIRRGFVDRLAAFDDLFQVNDAAVVLKPEFEGFDARNAALDQAVDRLVQKGVLPKKRRELYPVAARFGDRPLAVLDRGAVAAFGIRAYGVHVNGIVRGEDGIRLWIGRRARDKAVAPGKLDNLVAGGQPFGLTLVDNLVKECAEEADIPEQLARRARPVSAITYTMGVPEGLRADTLFVYDLEVPADFVPRNTDGELEDFTLMPLAEVAERVAATDDFKFNVSLVIIDFLIRHGELGPEHDDYLELVAGLHQ
jgi:8-oxo-dGTP pyrophosphatase MutT (NUDIX family)